MTASTVSAVQWSRLSMLATLVFSAMLLHLALGVFYLEDRPLVSVASIRHRLRFFKPVDIEWLNHAREFNCSIDDADYQGIARQLSGFKTAFNVDMIQAADVEQMFQLSRQKGLAHIKFRNGKVAVDKRGEDTINIVVDETVKDLFEPIARHLPDMDLLLNSWDEPVSLPHHASLDFFKNHQGEVPALTESNRDPYVLALYNSPRCSQASEQFRLYRDKHYFFGRTRTSFHKPSAAPIFSWTTVRNCYADLTLPTWHTRFHEPFAQADLIPWELKQDTLFWRGSKTGSSSESADEALQGLRSRFIQYAGELNAMNTTDSVPIDAGFTSYGFSKGYENEEEKFKQIFPKASFVPIKDQFKFKYLMMLDGWSFNERLYRFLSSGSVMFRATAFDEWYEDLMKPWEHYIPIRLDFSDLAEKLHWVKTHDREARLIAERARQLATRHLNTRSHKCYMNRLLFEYAKIFNSSSVKQFY